MSITYHTKCTIMTSGRLFLEYVSSPMDPGEKPKDFAKENFEIAWILKILRKGSLTLKKSAPAKDFNLIFSLK